MNWIWRILIKICAASQPNRVLIDKSPDIRIVVSERVVMQSSFLVKILTLVSEILCFGRVFPFVPSPQTQGCSMLRVDYRSEQGIRRPRGSLSCGVDVVVPSQTKEIERTSSQLCKHARLAADAAGILAHRDVTHVVQSVFNQPMIANRIGSSPRRQITSTHVPGRLAALAPLR